ncbi:Flp pilus assembly protein CpaB [Planctomicrobium sp.]|nr:Flp pilus assembly protein CpaB [Planctomicrobium sp.]MDB4439885.1 Flp pilus assembly protein CpaB [Planctomicrobium sp.]
MKPKTLILLAVAGGCGLVAMLGVQQAMKMTQDSAKTETKKVLVALANIEIGEVLNADSTIFKELPVDGLPPEEELIVSPEQYEERGARIQLFAGDVVTLSKLTEPGGTGNSVKIPRGMRVITIPVDESDSQSNLVSPGDRVDVLVTYQSGGRTGNTKTKTLMEFVEVFAADSRTADKVATTEKMSRFSHVSLLVMPEQVSYVKLAQKKGNLSLAWRHKLDDELVQIRDIDEDLLEELEGTIGINENRPLYGNNFSEEIISPGFQPFVPVTEEPVDDPAASALTLVEEVEVTPIVVEPVLVEPEVVQIEEKPKWTLHVYAGNTPTPHQFELEEEAIEDATAKSGNTNPLADTVRSLLNGG